MSIKGFIEKSEKSFKTHVYLNILCCNYLQKKRNREKPRLNREFRFISDISRDLNDIFQTNISSNYLG